jgi:hypothetical protein
MSAFVRVAIGCSFLMVVALLSVPAAWAATQKSPCDDETKFPQDNIQGVPTGARWSGPMKFQDGGVVPGYGRVIYAIGAIMAPTSKDDTNILDDSAQGFENFLKTAGVKPGALVVLHSPGGDVGRGIAIGEAIRTNSLRTMVGQPQTPDASSPLTTLATAAPTKGVCASACTMAFLGGTRRTVPNGSLYGVHAAEWEEVSQNERLAGIFLQGEKIAALTSAYLEEMGIDPSWLTLADQCGAGFGHILFLTPAQMAQTKTITAFTTSWTLLDDNGVIALAGVNSESSAIPGYNDDLILGCVGTPRRVVMRVDYLPEAYNAGEPAGAARSSPTAFMLLVSDYSLSGFKANSVANNQPMVFNIATSGAFAPLSVADLHHVTTTIAVTPEVANLLKGSDTLQFSFKGQLAPVGQVNFDLTDGRQEISDYIADCQ